MVGLPHAIVQDGSSSSCLQFHRFTAQGCFVHGGGFGSIALSPNNFRFKVCGMDGDRIIWIDEFRNEKKRGGG